MREGRRLRKGPEVPALTMSYKKKAALAGGGGVPRDWPNLCQR